MFSGKSEELLRRVLRALIARRKVQVFKSHLDDRYSGIMSISSHDGRHIEAVAVNESRQVAEGVEPDAQVVAIDEVQFLDDAIIDIVGACFGLEYLGVTRIVVSPMTTGTSTPDVAAPKET